jgi:hypothetical protein
MSSLLYILVFLVADFFFGVAVFRFCNYLIAKYSHEDPIYPEDDAPFYPEDDAPFLLIVMLWPLMLVMTAANFVSEQRLWVKFRNRLLFGKEKK